MYRSLPGLGREGSGMEMLAIVRLWIIGLSFQFHRCFGLRDSALIKAFRKCPLSPSCNSYTWRIWIPPLFFWYFKCLIHFPLHILLSFYPTASYLLHISFHSPNSPYHPVFPQQGFYFAGCKWFEPVVNVEIISGVFGLCLCLAGFPTLFRIEKRVRGMESKTYCLWQLSFMNCIRGNLRTCPPEITWLPYYATLRYSCWKWAVSAENILNQWCIMILQPAKRWLWKHLQRFMWPTK